ncbi:hypothetical protein PDE_02733 [Penicillium oxalicum 114-2]|uniref:Uncharacterized protein n=1 Tax=Penicillium oxalicum (strain 114-2 / CGMCC 5302) TaxID=933388 RepID=S7ZC23_PENO1|nr:hypothetical protein PDE_02733 [Penicillium oxalicum 114-2]
MASPGSLSQTKAPWKSSPGSLQHSTAKLQQSTSRLWRRSVSSWFDSKDRCHQATVETWHKSTDSWRRSKAVLDVQKENLLALTRTKEQKTLSAANKHEEITPKPSPDLSNAPSQQLSRSVIALEADSTPVSAITHDKRPSECKASSGVPIPPQPRRTTSSTSSPLAEPSTVSSMSAPSVSSWQSPIETGIDARAFSPLSVDLSVEKRRPDEQVRGLLRYTDHVLSQAQHTRQLRDTKSMLLSEVEHNWIHSTITDAVDSAQELSEVLELCRQDMAKRKGKGKISSANRKQWKLRNRERADERQTRLIRYQCRLDQVYRHLTKLKIPPSRPMQQVEQPALQHTPEMPTESSELAGSLVELSSEPKQSTFSEMPQASPKQQPILSGIAEMPVDLEVTSFAAELPVDKQDLAAATKFTAVPTVDQAPRLTERPLATTKIPRKALPIIAELPCNFSDTQLPTLYASREMPETLVTAAPDPSTTVGASNVHRSDTDVA